MSKPKDVYRLASPEERVAINRRGECWIVRVRGGELPDVSCPNKRVEGQESCLHHMLTNPLRSRAREEVEESSRCFSCSAVQRGASGELLACLSPDKCVGPEEELS